MTRRELIAGAGAILAAGQLQAFKSRITKANISAITDEIGATQADAIEFAHRYGMECVEVRNVPETKKEFSFLTKPELKQWAAQLSENKLKVTFLNASLFKFTWPGMEPGGKPESDTQRAANQKRWDNRLEDVEKTMRAATLLGCDKIRVFTGTRTADPESTFPMIARTVEELIPLAEKHKVRILVENENSENVGSSGELAKFLKLVPSKWVGYNWDPGNAQSLGETPWPDGYKHLDISRMMNAQFKAKNLLDGPEKLDWKAILEAMQKDGYKGHIGLETHGGPGTLLERANESMKRIMQMVGELS